MADEIATARVIPRSVGIYVARVTTVFAAQFAAGKLGDFFQNTNNGGIGPVWPAAGVALGAVLIYGYSVWPGVAAGAFLLVLLGLRSYGSAAVYAAGTTLAALASTFVLIRVTNFDRALSRVRDVLALIFLGAIGGSLISASIGTPLLHAFHVHGWAGFGEAWLVYWLGDATGVMLVTPVLLTFPAVLKSCKSGHARELSILLLLLAATCFVVFGTPALVLVRLLAFAVLPFVMWAALRFGIGSTALSILLIASIATVKTELGSGPFAGGPPLRDAVLLDLFFAVLSTTGLILAAVIAEKECAEDQRERLARQQAAIEVRLRLATIVESSDDAIVGVDMTGNVADWNKGAERLFGYSADEAIGKHIAFLAPADEREDAQDILKKVANGNIVSHFETVRQRKDGSRVHISLTVSPMLDATGRIVGVSGIARDITERLKAEDALNTSEKRSKDLVIHAPVAMVVTRGPSQEVELISRKFVELFGYTIEDVPDEAHWWPLAYPDEAYRENIKAEWQARTQRAVIEQAEIEPMEASVNCKDGSRRHIEFHFTSLGDTNLVSFVDLTDREQAEIKLRESEERFRLVANAAPVLIWMSGPDRLCNYFNQPWLDFTGRPLEAELGHGWAERVHSEDLNACLQIYSAAFDRREPFKMEYRLKRYDGHYRWIFDIGVPRFDPDGTFAGYIGSCIDVTDRKLAEEALSGIGRKLLEAQEQERKRIARELHDDVNQRIALLQIGLQRWSQQIPVSALDTRDHIKHACDDLSSIARDVQALSHRLHSSKLDYLGIVTAAKSFCKEVSEQRNVSVEFSHSDMPDSLSPEISLCLFRVLQEALQNGVKHSGARNFKVGLHSGGQEIRLTVSDQGLGFDLQDAVSRSGVGLISMQERLHLVNGKLSIESRLGAGTTVLARVPCPINEGIRKAR